MASKAQRNQQANFFADMQTMFFGTSKDPKGGEGIVGSLSQAAADLKAAADMLSQSTQAQPTYGGPNGNRPVFNGNGTRRPSNWGAPTYPGGTGFPGTYSQARSALADQIFSRAGSTGSVFRKGNQYTQHENADGETYYQEWDSKGNKLGQHANPESAEFKNAKAFLHRQNLAGGAAGAVAGGSIFTRGASGEVHTPGVQMVQNVLRNLGPYGMAAAAIIGAPDAISHTVTSERTKNAQYQAILGGSNWSTGFHNRRLAEGFKLSQMYSGGFNGKQSEEIFNGVTNLGYTGDLRNQALNFASSSYKNMGMGPGESLGFISTMAKSSSSNFEQLKTVLTELNKTAKETGQNLEQARSNLSNLFQVATAANGGAGALQSAGSVANFQAGLGRNFANVDFSNMLPGKNLAITSMMANSSGMQLGQFELSQAGGGSGAVMSLAQAQDKQSDMVVAAAASDPRVIAAIKNAAQKFPQDPVKNMTGFVAFCLQDQSFQSAMGTYLPQIQAAAQAFMGTSLSPEQAAEFVIRKVLGSGASFTKAAQDQKNSVQAYDSLKKGQTDQSLAAQGITKVGGKYMQDGQDITGSLMQRHDPILDKFKSQYDNQHVHMKVQTANGYQIVTGKYAYEHLKDQIAKGTATFADGPNAGQSVATVVGGGFGEENYKGPDTTHVKPTGKHFKDANSWSAGTGGKGGGTVIIQPSADLAKILNISATGNVVVANEAAAAGLKPSPNQTGLVNLN